MTERKDPRTRRVIVLIAIILLAFAGLAGQLANFTLVQSNAYTALANAQQVRNLPIPAPRGLIYDRNMLPLAENHPEYAVFIRYPFYKDADAIAKLAALLGTTVEKLKAQVDKQKDRPFEPIKVAENVTTGQATKILELKPELPGVDVEMEPVRDYPQKDLVAQVLGYVSAINQEQLDHLQSKGYLPGELIGQTGLEAEYEAYLHGTPGSLQVAVNNRFEPQGQVGEVPAMPGNNLVLTIDANLQRTAERALDWQLHRLQTIPNPGDNRTYDEARAGAVVVMDIKTGAILAMASRPAYDPNLFVGGISQKDWDALNKNPFLPLLNRAVQSAYQPGSTWKMMTGSAAVTAGVTTPYEKVFSGTEYAPTHQHDWVAWGHGWVDLPNALRLSSDIYFYEMGSRLGIDRLVQYAKGFGFGSQTGIDLPDEESGFLPDKPYRDKTEWWLGNTTSAAIGQIFTATPLQLVRYAAALANGGQLVRPYLVQTIQDAKGQVLKQAQPVATGKLPISQEALDTVVEGMRLVNGPEGTSDFAQWPLPGIPTAGKTGTAQNPPHDDYGLFVSFAPFKNPQIAIATVIEQAGHGSSISPVARSIYSDYFKVKLLPGDPAIIPDDFEPVSKQ
ncbi:MAG: penicillin-binding protein 2 [Mycobacterium leprae]